MSQGDNRLRALPGVDRLLKHERILALLDRYPRELVVQALRDSLEAERARLRAGEEGASTSELLTAAEERLSRTTAPSLRPVINATGVIIHTNLGRAPLSNEALRAMFLTSAGYSNLEYDLANGTRGSRHQHVRDLLVRLTGAEDAIAVNNNASGVLLVLSALAAGKEVVVSRGQAVEIGGGFRIPDVLRQSGARLVEVGTTNRTYLADYEAAITSETGLLLHVHPSNFRVEGFVHSPAIEELVALGRRAGLPVVDDLGSGALVDTARFGLAHEPMVQERIAAGTDLVCFSGDKLLGGPQAGLIAGKAGHVEALRRHPLARAVRIDKLAIAALSATLAHYLLGEALDEVPVWRMISMPVPAIEARARRMAARLRRAGIKCALVDGLSTVGGGSLPGETLPTRLLAVEQPGEGPSAAEMLRRLRHSEPPVVARVERERLVVDLRTVGPEADEVLAATLISTQRRR